MSTTHVILLLNALIKLTTSLLRLYAAAREAFALALWRRRLLRSLRQRRE